MSESDNRIESKEQVAEYLRLTLSKLTKHELLSTPLNYALLYFYIAGYDLALNDELDALFKLDAGWDEDKAKKLFKQHICSNLDGSNQQLRDELLQTIAQVIGSLVDLAGKTAISNSSLETHLEKLAQAEEPQKILSIATDIIADTRKFIEQSRDIEATINETTQEISFLRDELDHARRQATIDALTGLHNRRGFNEAIEISQKSALSEKENFCLMIFDIDHFKQVNDTHGHLVGDKVLVGLAKLLMKHMRGNDYLSRFGGEEFAVILPDTPVTAAFTVAENLRKSIEKLRLKQVKTGQEIGQITVSMGLANYRSGESVEELIARCDKALYRAKKNGRNRTVLAD